MVEENERVRRGVCASNERSLSEFESVPVDEEKAGPVPESWDGVVCELEDAACILLLQLFWASTPVR